MEMKRIFTICTVALLLSVPSLAMACDISCGFAQPQSDCHASQVPTDESMPAGMAMDGMTMSGMNGTDSGNQEIAFGHPPSESRHAVIADMGPCERQSCDPEQTVAAKLNHYSAAQFETILAVAEFPRIDGHEAASHDARDAIALLSPIVHGPLSISLRI